MLGGRVVVDGEEQEIAGFKRIKRQRDHVAAGGIGQRLFAQRFGPIARIGGRVFGIGSIDRSPDAAHEAKTIAADALQRRLMVIGRADPRARFGEDGLSDRDVILPPSLPAPWFG